MIFYQQRYPEFPQFYNMQGLEIDEDRLGFECVIKYLKKFPPEFIAIINKITFNTVRRYFVLDPSNIDEDHVGSGIVKFQQIKVRLSYQHIGAYFLVKECKYRNS